MRQVITELDIQKWKWRKVFQVFREIQQQQQQQAQKDASAWPAACLTVTDVYLVNEPPGPSQHHWLGMDRCAFACYE